MTALGAAAPGLTVMMEKARRIEIRTRKAVLEQLGGGYRSIFHGQGLDFEEVREYVPGDDVRAIDWNVTARAGAPFVKKFREERELTVILAVDVSASGDFGSGPLTKRELAAELASVLALAGLRSRDRIGLVMFSDRVERFVPPRRGRGHVLRLVHEILGLRPEGKGTDLAAALEFVHRVTRRRAAVILLSDFQHLGDARAVDDALRLAAHRHELVALWLQDPHELALPDVGEIAVEDAETGEVVILDAGRKKVRERFRALARARREQLRERLHGVGASVLELDTTASYLPPLAAFLRDRRRVA